jgi:transcription factor WhiB
VGEWRLRAGCRGMDPELWFPRSADSADARKALHVCRTHCPVWEDCLAWVTPRVTGGMVAGGWHWVTVKGSAGRRVRQSTRTRPTAQGCLKCLEPS